MVMDFRFNTNRKPSTLILTFSADWFGSLRQGTPMIDLMKMMKQAQEIQGRMQQVQQDLAALEVEGQSGAGMVTVKLNGKFEARGIKIDPSLLKPEEAEMLEDLILAAFQDAKGKAEAAVQAKMQEVTGGLNLPPGLKLF
jgi:nucleoid-associated protein EbfC